MAGLETRIPPPLVGLACGLAIWGLDRAAPGLRLEVPFRAVLTALIALPGLALEVWAIMRFVRARTTVNPLDPALSTALVIAGPYRFTRNPMYLGMALLLTAWMVWLGQPLGLIGVGLFVAWITRFQIIPEERALQARFGAEFTAFRQRVRRWI
jgi:protein-S-isoprenylcysteine O-methyltransferase Ste14